MLCWTDVQYTSQEIQTNTANINLFSRFVWSWVIRVHLLCPSIPSTSHISSSDIVRLRDTLRRSELHYWSRWLADEKLLNQLWPWQRVGYSFIAKKWQVMCCSDGLSSLLSNFRGLLMNPLMPTLGYGIWKVYDFLPDSTSSKMWIRFPGEGWCILQWNYPCSWNTLYGTWSSLDLGSGSHLND